MFCSQQVVKYIIKSIEKDTALPNLHHKEFILFLHNNCHPFIYHNQYYLRNHFIARWQLHHQAQHGQHQEKKGALF